ncbi:hypothetical protein SK128_008793 [Halocaridina rubra]|uniref:Uncharacterized protein n=1 Tax=Halocaridina rubra TaxID=373956 RepID=A0AAN8X0R7_HALRR
MFQTQNSVGKILGPVFWHNIGELHIKYLPKGHTITAEYNMSPLDELREASKQKRLEKLSCDTVTGREPST